jgi:hypothetical protein
MKASSFVFERKRFGNVEERFQIIPYRIELLEVMQWAA